jgi:hypothetical protein
VSGWQFFFAIVAVAFAMGNLVMAHARTRPKEAVSALSEWAEFYGVHKIPAWLRNERADAVARNWSRRVVIASILAGAFGGAVWYWGPVPREPNQMAAILRNPSTQQSGPQSPSTLQVPLPNGGPISWEGTLWMYNLSPQSDGKLTHANQPSIGTITFRGTVQGDSPVELKDAYIISELTGEKRTFSIISRPGYLESDKLSLNEINPIPPGAQIQLVIQFNPTLSVITFYNTWGKMKLHIEYDHENYERQFKEDAIKNDIVRDIVGADLILGIPRVTKKPSDQSVQ